MSTTSRDDTRGDGEDHAKQESPLSNNATPAAKPGIFSTPPALKRLFDSFPLTTYPTNPLPRRAPRNRNQNVLYIFTTPSSASQNAPSFNPSCLKHQTYLHIAGIPFTTSPSTNHASPSGSLPFLIPANTASTAPPLTGSKLTHWTTRHARAPSTQSPSPTTSASETLYTSLLTGPIRLAYLYALYLHPASFTATAKKLYVDSSSASSLVRFGLTHPLRQAALEEILNARRASTGGKVDVEGLFRDAEGAFGALSVLLGEWGWFGEVVEGRESDRAGHGDEGGAGGKEQGEGTSDEFAAQGGQQRESGLGLFEDGENTDDAKKGGNTDGRRNDVPSTNPDSGSGAGMLDAAVFSYTHNILSLFADLPEAGEEEAWSPARRLVGAIERHENLVRHRERIFKRYYPSSQA